MYLEELPTEILYAISKDVAAFGSSRLIGLTRVSSRLHAIANPILYSTDVLKSGGAKSMDHGLKEGLNEVVKLCLIAGADPNLRITSHHDLDSCYLPLARTPSLPPKESDTPLMDSPGLDDHLENEGNAHSPTYSESVSDSASDFDYGVPLPAFSRPHRWATKLHYWTALHVAATRADIELLSILLDHGANPNSAGRGVCSCYDLPLRRTTGGYIPPRGAEGLRAAPKKLLTRWSPLHVAVCKGNLDCAEMLIDRFGLARATESDDTVRAEAKRFVKEEPMLSACQIWLGRYIDDGTPAFDPSPPLHVAAGKYETVGALERVYAMLQRAGCLQGPNAGIDILDAFRDTPFAVAALSGRMQLFGSWLCDHGANVDFILRRWHGNGDLSLFNALCQLGLYRDAIFLMDMGFDVNLHNKLHLEHHDDSALHLCCRFSAQDRDQQTKHGEAIELIKRLIRAGANIEARALFGFTPLMLATLSNFTAAICELLVANAEIGAVSDDGESALHFAVEHGLRQKPGPGLSATLFTIQLLLDNGADPNQRSENRGPPLFSEDYALEGYPLWGGGNTVRNSMASIAPLLINRGADPNIYLEDSRGIGKGDIRDQLSQLGGKSLAVSAFYWGEFSSLDSLIACGTLVTRQHYLLMMQSLIDENVRSIESKSDAVEALFRVLNSPSLTLERPEDRTSIMDAWTEVLYHAVGSRPRLVHDLAPHISLTNVCGPGGKSVLHLMSQWEPKKNERPDLFEKRIAEVMIDLFRCGAGRQIDQPDNSGRSPLHIAVDRGNIPVASQLVELGASLHIEHRNPNGSITISPLRAAIRSYSKGSQFKVAAKILEVSSSKHGSTDPLCGNLGLLKDLILHFGGNPFDNPARMSARTTELMKRLFAIGVDVNESDEHGSTALHHLIQLLHPSDRGPRNPGHLEDAYCSQLPGYAISSSLSIKSPAQTGAERHFELSEERDRDFKGHNLTFYNDSDYHPDYYDQPNYGSFSDDDSVCGPYYDDHPEHDQPEHDKPEHDIFADDDSDSSNIIDCVETFPPNELGELVNHDPHVASDRCDTWMSSFFLLLVQNASITMKNNSGKTALDYIDELMDCEPLVCRKMYCPVIPALREFVKRPPFDPQLLATLDDSRAEAKGRPLLFVHDQIHLSMDENGPEEAREAERQARARGETCWVPFW